MKKLLVVFIMAAVTAFYSGCSTGDTGPAGANGTNGADGDISVVFQTGLYPATSYAGTADNTLSSTAPTSNYGTLTMLGVGMPGGAQIIRPVIRFDLSYIVPSTVVATSATLTLTSVSGTSAGNTITAYALTENFTETGSTWNTYDGVNGWTTAGGDYAASSISDSQVAAYPAASQVTVLTLSASVVQSWITDPSSNHGMILVATNETSPTFYVNVASAESGILAYRPKLTVHYTLP